MPKPDNDIIIQLSSVSKRYGFGDSENYALKNFDLTVRRGEFIMIMGPSGCGKTTLLNIIGLLDKATFGEYMLGGKSVTRISPRKKARFRARQIGFIFQNFNLISNLPVIENVALPLLYAGYHKTRRLKMASNMLDHFHLQEREYYMPWQLSGGQQQRVAIARSLVASPSIILADEPTGNLDSRSSHVVMEELRDIHSLGNTIIMVTHNPALTTYATRVINMLDGEIDTDIKTVADRDLPRPGDPEKISVRILPKSRPKTSSTTTSKPDAKPTLSQTTNSAATRPFIPKIPLNSHPLSSTPTNLQPTKINTSPLSQTTHKPTLDEPTRPSTPKPLASPSSKLSALTSPNLTAKAKPNPTPLDEPAAITVDLPQPQTTKIEAESDTETSHQTAIEIKSKTNTKASSKIDLKTNSQSDTKTNPKTSSKSNSKTDSKASSKTSTKISAKANKPKTAKTTKTAKNTKTKNKRKKGKRS